MWGKLLAALAIVSIVAAAGLVFDRIVVAFGDARYAQGKADAQVAQIPAIRAADTRAMRIAIDGRDRVIATQNVNMSELGRLSALALAANDKVTAYAPTTAGMAACLGPERVRGIEADRAALFPPAASAQAAGAASGPVPTLSYEDPGGPQPQQR